MANLDHPTAAVNEVGGPTFWPELSFPEQSLQEPQECTASGFALTSPGQWYALGSTRLAQRRQCKLEEEMPVIR